MKKNFEIDENVVLRRLGSDGKSLLEGATGKILGKSFAHAETDFYMVLLDHPVYHPEYIKAVCMIESCIDRQPAKSKIECMIDELNAEQFRVKRFINENRFDCTTAPFVIARRYRNELKQHIVVLRENLEE